MSSSSSSYEDYEQEYKAYLSRIRSFLAGTRSRSTLMESERLLADAKKAATAMQGLAEVEGNPMRVTEAKNLINRDINPLAKEVQRALQEMGREELFYQAPDLENNNETMESLIQSSEDLLRESQSILADTEQVGTTTLQQMGQQREQLENANRSLEGVQAAALRAKTILTSMSRRAFKNKFALYVMIAILGAANLYVLFCIYKKHHHHASADDGPNEGPNY